MTQTQSDQVCQRWEYKTFTKQTEVYLITELNEAGREGWELVSVSYNKDLKGIWGWAAFLKRPLGVAHVAMGTGSAAQNAQAAKTEDPLRGFQMTDGDFELKD